MAPIPVLDQSAKATNLDDAPDRRPRQPRLNPGKILAAAVLFIVALGVLGHHKHRCHRSAAHVHPGTVEERAHEVLKTTPLIDGHVDFPVVLRFIYGNRIYEDNFTQPFVDGGLPGHVDLARLRQGLSGGAFWSVYAPCPEDGDDFSDENYAASVQFTLDQIDVMARLQAEYPKDFSGNLHSSTAMEAFSQGKLISPLGVEGLHQIGNKVANLRRYYDLGVRYATLTHNCHNKYADAALTGNPSRKAKPLWGGVSPLGRQLVHEMNRMGMIVDLAHVSDDTMVDVLGGNSSWEGSKAPVIYSHSSVWAVCPHPRNVKDEILELVKKRNSLVMINIAPPFIACRDTGSEDGVPEPVPEDATLDQLVKHILHIGNLIGFDHVGVGTDFDGIESVPEGFEDVSKYPDLVAELLRQGVSDSDAAKVVGGNAIRVWKDVDAVAAKMQADGARVMEDDLPTLRLPGASN